MGVLPRRPGYIELTDDERGYLETLAQQTAGPHREARRAQLVLLFAEGCSDAEVCQRVGYSTGTVRVWRRRFAKGRLASLYDMPRSFQRAG